MRFKHGTGRSIRFYLALSYTLFVLIGLTVVGMIWFSRLDVASDDALLLQVKERARLMASLSNFDTLPENDLILPEVTTAINQSLIVMYITPALDIERLSDLPVDEEVRRYALALSKEALDSGFTVAQKADRDRWGGYELLYAAAPVFNASHQISGLVCLILPMRDFRAAINRLRLDLLGLAAILAGMGLLLGFGLAAMFSRPIKRAGVMAARVADGDYSVRLPGTGPTELIDLSENLNQMAEDLGKQAQLRSQMLANVAHELSRPLGALRLGVDSLRSGAIRDEVLASDLLGEISRTIQSMSRLVEDLDLASRDSSSHIRLEMHPVLITPLLQELRSRFRLTGESRGITLDLLVPDDLPPVLGDEHRLIQIFGNLIDNAFKFTPAGGKVTVSAYQTGAWVEVDVADNGVGIPPENLEHIFEPFYQGNRQIVNRGVGLGLSIVHRLVSAHGGDVCLENRASQGTIARVRLQIAEGQPLPGD